VCLAWLSYQVISPGVSSVTPKQKYKAWIDDCNTLNKVLKSKKKKIDAAHILRQSGNRKEFAPSGQMVNTE
jgi:hypothetical protein